MRNERGREGRWFVTRWSKREIKERGGRKETGEKRERTKGWKEGALLGWKAK